MDKNFITLPDKKIINLNYVMSIEYLGSMDASMLGEFLIQNHSDGNAYIMFTMSNNEREYWAFANEAEADTNYKKLAQSINFLNQ